MPYYIQKGRRGTSKRFLLRVTLLARRPSLPNKGDERTTRKRMKKRELDVRADISTPKCRQKD